MGQELRLEGVRKVYGSGDSAVVAIENIDLQVQPGEFMTIVGPSGCGKSTFLQICAGLIAPTSGRVLVGGSPVSGPPEGLVYLFQQYSKSLLPWRTVLQNVAFAIEHRPVPAAQRREYCMHYLSEVGLAEFADRYPRELSGGMQQRVAIARALSRSPRLILADEPTGNLDTHTADDIFALLREFNRERGSACLIVTHDPRLAARCDRRIELVDGRLAAPSVLQPA